MTTNTTILSGAQLGLSDTDFEKLITNVAINLCPKGTELRCSCGECDLPVDVANQLISLRSKAKQQVEVKRPIDEIAQWVHEESILLRQANCARGYLVESAEDRLRQMS